MRNNFARDSLRARMTRGFALFIGALLLLAWFAFTLYTRHVQRRDEARVLANNTEELRDALSASRHLSPPQMQRTVAEEGDELRALGGAILVFDGAEKIVATSKKHPVAFDDNWSQREFPSGKYRVVLGIPRREYSHESRERIALLLALCALVAIASAAGAWVLVGRTLSPIDALAQRAAAASTESLHVQLTAPSRDMEIARLVETLNQMLNRLGETAALRGRFYAAAAHELRTPLQALMGHLEVALSRPRTAPELESALRESHTQAERLTTLVQDLLLLNQLESAASRAPAMALDFADVCETELSHLQLLLRERGASTRTAFCDDCEIEAPWNHAVMLVRNLLENAAKYAARGSIIEIEIARENGALQLSIFNSCDLPGGDLSRFFEPFYRPDESRNSATGGNGLGLAICRAICDADGWKISLHRARNGVQARVVLRDSPGD